MPTKYTVESAPKQPAKYTVEDSTASPTTDDTSTEPGMFDPHGKWNIGDLFRGAGSGIYSMIRHPGDTLAGMAQPFLATGMAPGGMYPTTAATGRPQDTQANQQVQQEAQQGQTQQAQQMVAHPLYAAGSVLGPALLTHGLTKLAKVPINAAGKFARSLSDTSPQVAADLATKTAETNTKAATEGVTKGAENARVAQENLGSEHTLELRRQKEADLAKNTEAYYAQEDAAKAKAKGEENAAWSPWRAKIQNATVDGGTIAAPLQKIAAISPDVQRALRQLIPSAEDAPGDSQFARDRQQIMLGQGLDGSYENLPPDRKATVDKIALSMGFEPDPIDFDPQAGRPVPLEQIHRVKAILGQYLGSGRYEGPLLGEMKQVYKVLDQAETRGSMQAGALDDLQAGKEATKTYQKTFGRQRHLPTTQDEIREKTANPEAYREREDEMRLDAARQYDPTLADAYEGVKSAREDLKRLPTEDQLRKGLKQPPNTAEEVNPTPKQIGPEDIQQAKAESAQKKGETVRGKGGYAGLRTTLYSIPTSIGTLALGHPFAALAELGAGPSVYATAQGLASALENPHVVKMLSKVTVADIDKIPPELRTDALNKMRSLAVAAKMKGYPVSPAIMAWAGLSTTGSGLPPNHPLNQNQPLGQVTSVQ